MNRLIPILYALLLSAPVMADEVAVSATEKFHSWVVVDDTIYLCWVGSVKAGVLYEGQKDMRLEELEQNYAKENNISAGIKLNGSGAPMCWPARIVVDPMD